MVECHAKRAREKIAEKKAEGNIQKLDRVVDQIKVKTEERKAMVNFEYYCY